MPPKKRFRVSNLQLREISSVDNPAQVGAVAVLLKAADGEFTAILKNAEAVVGGAEPEHARAEYEDAMFARAEQLAKDQRCTPEQALARNLSTDAALRKLAYASEVANVAEFGAFVRTGRAMTV